ncbi:unnamed protein product [Mytilus coruscus]|uniref:Uncharacterized protein n=1 Tax=Mytilus coruscus TaxID=42192 RepID=A0A6J8EV55_MYTCO|nr:unnamed protein product [Mytilus coruscus]
MLTTLYTLLYASALRGKKKFDLVVQLLGISSDVDDCLKYRKLKQKHPGHESFVSAFDQSFCKLQIMVSKRYFALKEETTKDYGKENMGNPAVTQVATEKKQTLINFKCNKCGVMYNEKAAATSVTRQFLTEDGKQYTYFIQHAEDMRKGLKIPEELSDLKFTTEIVEKLPFTAYIDSRDLKVIKIKIIPS